MVELCLPASKKQKRRMKAGEHASACAPGRELSQPMIIRPLNLAKAQTLKHHHHSPVVNICNIFFSAEPILGIIVEIKVAEMC